MVQLAGGDKNRSQFLQKFTVAEEGPSGTGQEYLDRVVELTLFRDPFGDVDAGWK